MISKWCIAAAATLCLSFGWMAPAAAQSDPQWDTCQGNVPRDARTTIEACRASLPAMMTDNERADAYNNLGVAYSRDGQDDRALSSFNEAMRAIRGHSEREYRELSDMIRFNRAKAYMKAEDYQAAVDDYDVLLKSRPGYAPYVDGHARAQDALDKKTAPLKAAAALANRGPGAREKCIGKFEGYISSTEMILACTAVIDSRSDYTQVDRAAALMARAALYVILGLYDRAVEDCEAAPNFVSAYVICGNAYRGLGNYMHAIEEYDRAIKLIPDFVEARVRRGEVYDEMGDHDRAVAIYKGVLQLAATTPSEFAFRAEAHENLKDYAAAAADYDKAVSIAPRDARVLGTSCWFRATHQLQPDIALQRCNEAVELSGRPEAFNARALVFYEINAYESAIADADSALDLDPKKAGSLYVRGLAKLKTGDAPAGNADIAAAKAIDPKIAETYAVYGLTP
jgi:tetratricopeptide (TPR) repeat protein